MTHILRQFRIFLMIGFISFTGSGCSSLKTRIQPVNNAVPDKLKGRDCTGLFFGLGFGDISADRAMFNTRILADDTPKGEAPYGAGPPITRVRTVDLSDYNFLFINGRCIEVTGDN